MAREVAYRPLPYARSGSTLAQLLLRQGEQQAEAERRRGDISAQMWSNLGQQVGGAITGYAKEQQDAPIRAMQEESARLALDNQRAEADERKQLSRQDSAFMSLFELHPDGNIPPQEVMAVYGPQRGMAVAQGLEAFKRLGVQDAEEQRQNIGRLAVGLKALSPEMQAEMWPSVRASIIGAGIADEGMLSEEFNPQILDASIAWATGQMPEIEKPMAVNPGQRVIDPRTGQEIYAAPNAPQRPVSVAPGGRLVNPETGEVTYQAPPGPPTSRAPQWVVGPDGEFLDLAGVAPPGSKPANIREQGRPVTSGDAGRLAELDTSLDDLAVLRQTVSGLGATGTSARVGAAMPNWITEWTGAGADAKSKQGVIDRVRQVIGKALEGGVLRKEDEIKYEKILPTIGDVPEVVESKLAGLERAIALRRERLIESLTDAGYDISAFAERGASRSADSGPAVGERRTINGQLAEWDGNGWLAVPQ